MPDFRCMLCQRYGRRSRPSLRPASTCCGAIDTKGKRLWATVFVVVTSVTQIAEGQSFPPCYNSPGSAFSCNPGGCDANACDPASYVVGFTCQLGSQLKPSPPAVRCTDLLPSCDQPLTVSNSKCFGSSEGGTLSPDTGFPLNLNLVQGFGPGDYPPLSQDIFDGSSPIIPNMFNPSGSASTYPVRPTDRGIIDLITGQPLLQEVDFELPFGGAIFRHVRTYSENPASDGPTIDGSGKPADGTFWDWNGLFWMMGENPIFLIDLSYDYVGLTPSSLNAPPPVNPPAAVRRCYFIPDAHHAIPFIYQTGTGNYVAPSWFDARLDHNGTINTQTGLWSNPPTEFYVWLNRGSVKYTIKAHYEDHWLDWDQELYALVEVNDPPVKTSGFRPKGIPHYGLVTRIDDRNGNHIVIDHCLPNQVQQDDAVPPNNYDNTHTNCCIECAQQCNAKGQINFVKLYSAGNISAPEWTLIYTHRGFLPVPGTQNSRQKTLYRQNALHTIHAYRGDRAVDTGVCRTIPGATFCAATSLDEIDAITHSSIPDGWLVEARYMYSEFGVAGPSAHCTPANLIGDSAANVETIDGRVGQRLIKATITKRGHQGEQPSADLIDDRNVTIYRDGLRRQNTSLRKVNAYSYLKAVIRNDTVRKLMTDNGWQSPNEIFALPETNETQDDTVVVVKDPRTGLNAIPPKKFWQTSNIFMKDCDGVDYTSLQAKAAALKALYGFSTETLYSPVGRQVLRDRRNGTESLSVYYRFISVPASHPGTANPGNPEHNPACCYSTYSTFTSMLSYHYPFLVNVNGTAPCASGSCPPKWMVPSLANPLYTMVIDEVDADTHDGDQAFDEDSYWSGTGSPIGLKSRRIVEMNPAGFILRDRKWTCNDGTCTLSEQDGAEETFVHDCKGRVVERRTKGWNSPLNTQPADDGLIYVYKYEDNCPVLTETNTNCGCTFDYQIVNPDLTPRPAELMAEGFKKGTNGQVKYLRSFAREKPWRYDLVTKETRYRNPDGNLNPGIESPDHEIIQYDYDIDNGREGRPVTYKQVLRSGVPNRSGGAPMYLVERTKYNLQGNPTWLSIGSIAEPTTTQPVAGDELFVTANLFDPVGHLLESVSDFFPGTATQPPGGGFHTGCYAHQNYRLPTEFGDSRFIRNSTAPQLNQHTLNFWHWGDSYPWHVLLPNKKQIWRIKTLPPDSPYGTEEQWDFSDFVLNSYNEGNTPCVAWPTWEGGGSQSGTGRNFGPIKISRSRDGKLESVKTIATDLPLGIPQDVEALRGLMENPPTSGPTVVTLSVSYPKYDAQGRMVGMETAEDEQSLPALTSYIAYDGWGNIDRQQDPDGTITRKTYDEKGRLEKVYKGTNDYHSNWGAGDCPQPNSNCYTDNLTLVEKRYYGEVRDCGTSSCNIVVGDGTNDIDQLVQVRNYRDKPNNLYGLPPQGQNPNQDTLGWVMNYRYDWRQRPVWVQKKDSQGNNLNHTLTYYDNLDRVRLVAEFGPTGFYGENYSAPEPPTDGTVTDSGAASMVSTLLGNHPISLSETIYNRRGQVQETRSYNVADTSGTQYTATVNYYGTWNKPTEVHAPNSPIMRYKYDGKGRQVSASTMAKSGSALVEVARTETSYNLEDKPTVVRRMEALHTTTAETLDDANSVSTWTHTWYDSAGRVIATANFGTNNAADTFVTGDAPPPYITNPASGTTTPPVNFDSQWNVTGCNASLLGAPITPQVTCYAYDGKGRQWKVFHPDGTITETLYDSFGRTIETKQNAGSTDPNLIQRTAYVYNNGTPAQGENPAVGGTGQLKHIKAILPDNSEQVTEMIYGADVVDSGFATISQNNAFIKEVKFPDRVTGAPSADGDHFLFKYYPDGSVAERIDQRGIVMRFKYDELGRLIETLVNDGEWYPQPGENQEEYRPANRISRITYTYTSDGMPYTVTAHTKDGNGNEGIISQNTFAYDERQNLLREYQDHPDVGLQSVPRVDYAWAYSPMLQNGQPTGGNYNRLLSMTYPEKGVHTGVRRTITMGYGTTGTLDDALSRIAALTSTNVTGTLATYKYAGTGRRVGKTMANGKIDQNTWGTGTTGYERLDRFGRVKDLFYTLTTNNSTLRRDEYGYNNGMGSGGCGCSSGGASGDRVYDRVTQKNFGGANRDNVRSWLYKYDTLHRLTNADVGTLNSSNNEIVPTTADPVPVQTAWNLNNLGNWTGVPGTTPGVTRISDINGDGIADPISYRHDVNQANEITQVVYGGIDPTVISFINDPAGNLAYDGQYIYQYDAWNRLIEVDLPGDLPANWDGHVLSEVHTGNLVCRYTYDGLGRLIIKETPVVVGESTEVQRKDLYYDGVRRIQETILRGNLAPITGEGGNDEGAFDPEDPENPNASTSQPSTTYYWTDREYAYGPEYVDEFICQFAEMQPTTMYMLQDANYNVVALTNGIGNLLEQVSFDPYGTVHAVDVFSAHAVNRVGHQGLFFERYDGAFDQPTIAPNIAGLYYNRNRYYSPSLGRFITRDPNETGIPILTALAMNGEIAAILLRGVSGETLYGDGMSLYQYLRSNPANGRDPLGLDAGNLISTLGSQFINGIIDTMDSLSSLAAKAFAFERLLQLARLGRIAVQVGFYYEALRLAGDQLGNNEGRLTKRNCQNLYNWCMEKTSLKDCFVGFRNCYLHGQWDQSRWPLPPEADPYESPPGYGP